MLLLYKHLSTFRRMQLALLIAISVVAAIANLIGIGAVAPFLALLQGEVHLQGMLGPLDWLLEHLSSAADPKLSATLLLVCSVAAAAAIKLLFVSLSAHVSFNIAYDIDRTLYERSLHQPYLFHVTTNSADIFGGISKVDTGVVQLILAVLQSVGAAISVVTITVGLALVQPAVTGWVFGAFALMYLVVTLLVMPAIRRNGERVTRAVNFRTQSFLEGLGGIREILLDSSQAEFVRIFSRVDYRYRRGQSRSVFLRALPRAIIEGGMICGIVGAAYFYFSSTSPSDFASTVPVIGVFVFGVQRLLPYAQEIYGAFSTYQNNRAALADVLGLIELPRGQKSGCLVDRISFDTELRLKDVWFSYSRGEEVLKNFNLAIRQGSLVGIVGATGSGKSTLLDIILGLLEPQKGEVTVDGVAISQKNAEVWRRQVAHVPQYIYLTDKSLAENIAFGAPRDEIDMERVAICAKIACIDDYIQRLPDGYETLVGERGSQLSGGQRQRVGIARAMYKRAQLLVLDEATSALDVKTESQVVKNILDSEFHSTLIMVTHREETLGGCDRVIDLEKLNFKVGATDDCTER